MAEKVELDKPKKPIAPKDAQKFHFIAKLPSAKKEKPDAATDELKKELAEAFESLDAKEKNVFVDKEKEAKKKYDQDMKAYEKEMKAYEKEQEKAKKEAEKKAAAEKKASAKKSTVAPTEKPKKPPAPKDAQQFHFIAKLPSAKKEKPDAATDELKKELAEAFESLDAEEKKTYTAKAEEAEKKYEVDVKAYETELAAWEAAQKKPKSTVKSPVKKAPKISIDKQNSIFALQHILYVLERAVEEERVAGTPEGTAVLQEVKVVAHKARVLASVGEKGILKCDDLLKLHKAAASEESKLRRQWDIDTVLKAEGAIYLGAVTAQKLYRAEAAPPVRPKKMDAKEWKKELSRIHLEGYRALSKEDKRVYEERAKATTARLERLYKCQPAIRILKDDALALADTLQGELKALCGAPESDAAPATPPASPKKSPPATPKSAPMAQGEADVQLPEAAREEVPEALRRRYAALLHAVGYFEPQEPTRLASMLMAMEDAQKAAEDVPMEDAASNGGDVKVTAKQLAAVAGIRGGQMHEEVTYITERVQRWHGKRTPLTANKREEVAKAKAKALKNSVAVLKDFRAEAFGKFCAPPAQEDLPMVRGYCAKLPKRQSKEIMEAFLGAEQWDPVLDAIRDALDHVAGAAVQRRGRIVPLWTELLQNPPFLKVKARGGEYPDEGALTLDPLPALDRLDLAPNVMMLLGDIFLCFVHVHVFAKVLKMTRFSLSSFLEAISDPNETPLLRTVYQQLLCLIEGCEEADKAHWMEHALNFVAQDTKLDADDESSSSDEEDEESSEASSESATSSSEEDSSEDESSASSSEDESSESESESESESVDSDDSMYDGLTERQKVQRIAKARAALEARRSAQKQAKERKEKAKKAAVKRKEAAKKKKEEQKQAEEEKRQEAKQKEKEARAEKLRLRKERREARQKYFEENKDEIEAEQRRLREAMAAKEAAMGDHLTDAIRSAVEHARDLLDDGSNLKHWDLTTRILILRGLLRAAHSSEDYVEALKELEAYPATVKATQQEQEQKALKASEKRVERIKNNGTIITTTEVDGDTQGTKGSGSAEKKPAKGKKKKAPEVAYDDATTEKLKAEEEKLQLELTRIRFIAWEKACSNCVTLAPLGSDRHRRLYFKVPSDTAVYVFSPAVERKTLAAECSVGDVEAWPKADADKREAAKADLAAEYEEAKAAYAARQKEREAARQQRAEEEAKASESPQQSGSPKGRKKKKKVDEESESEEPEDPAEARPVHPRWAVLHGEWHFLELDETSEEFLQALSSAGRHERELKAALEVLSKHLEYEADHRPDKWGEGVKYQNRFKSRQSYLPDDVLVEPA